MSKGTVEPSGNKIAVCITFHYVETRVKYLIEVCKGLENIAPVVDLTIVTNTPEKIESIRALINENKFNLSFFVPYGLGHPYLLAWSHMDIFRKQFADLSYTHFLYLEDDIKVTAENILYWLCANDKLKPLGFYPSFFRVEQNDKDHQWYSTDVMTKMSLYDCPVVNAEGETFVNIVYPYQGMYLLDRELMAEHINGPSGSPDYDHHHGKTLFTQPYQVRETASLALSFAKVPNGFRSRNLLPFNESALQINPACFVHHLPNNYTNDPAVGIGKIQVNDLFVPRSAKTYLKKKVKTAVAGLVNSLISR